MAPARARCPRRAWAAPPLPSLHHLATDSGRDHDPRRRQLLRVEPARRDEFGHEGALLEPEHGAEAAGEGLDVGNGDRAMTRS